MPVWEAILLRRRVRRTVSQTAYSQVIPESHSATPLMSASFVRAFSVASAVHASQVRKGTEIPYIAHLMAVASLVLEAGGSDVCATAALLHDVVEDSRDGEAQRQTILVEFGEEVAAIVDGCSDAVSVPGTEKPPWRPRKEAYLRHLEAETNPDVLMVSACDKLHNARSIVADLNTQGDSPAFWDRFNSGKEAQLWYYESLVRTFEGKVAQGNSHRRFANVVHELAKAVAEMSAAAAPQASVA